MSLTTKQSGGTRQEKLRRWVPAVTFDLRRKPGHREVRIFVALNARHHLLISDGDEFRKATVSIAFVEAVREAYNPIDRLSETVQRVVEAAIDDLPDLSTQSRRRKS